MRNVWSNLLGFSLASLCTETSRAILTSDNGNANHIFNAIHSSMRQWGSSLNHNGMSFFLATVPEGTQLYHGRGTADPVNGTEWLAFEPEHALVFARSRHGPPPGQGSPGEGPLLDHGHEAHHSGYNHHDQPNDGHHREDSKGRQKYMSFFHDGLKPRSKSGHVDKDGSFSLHPHGRPRPSGHRDTGHSGGLEMPQEEPYGYLHTYRAKHDLKLIYIDGQSAAKSSKGTLDSQDIVLLHNTPPPSDDDHQPPRRQKTKDRNPQRPGGPMNESFRAEHLCEMARTEWQRKIDGFLRMELGFEIILCSFKDDLEAERVTRTKESDAGGPPGFGDSGDGFAYYQAVASRFDGIGGHRVHLDYDSFVSMYAVPDAVYLDDSGLPRIKNDTKLIEPVQQAIKNMAIYQERSNSVNWQVVTDMLLARYSDRIEYLASGDLRDLAFMKAEADIAMRPFIDYGDRNGTAEVERCIAQYIPQQVSNSNTTAAVAVSNVTTTICSTLLAVEMTTAYAAALDMVRSLKSWLAWTTWKRCRGCSYHEVCFIPIWPMGGAEDHENPKCISKMSDASRGYWGDFGPPPH